MYVKETDSKVPPIVTGHWKYKFEKSIPILLKSGYTIDELIDTIKNINDKENNNTNK